jgi:arylsulfatase A-like enzyme
VEAFPVLFGLNRGLLLRDVLGPAVVRVLPVNATMVRARPLWSILAEAGVSVGVVNWLVTWPADADGAAFLVSDRAWTEARPGGGAPGEAKTSPAEAQSRHWDPPEVGELLPRDPAGWRTEDAFVVETAKRLHDEYRPQVLVAYFRDVDAAEHLSWDEWEPRMFPRAERRAPRAGPVRETYLRFDAALGELRAAVGADATVIVVSDHGHRAWFTWLGRGTPGGHTDSPDGVFIAAGPGIRPSEAPIDPSLYDIAPTVLRLVGLPTAADMEGRPLREILADPGPLPAVATWEGRSRGTGTMAVEDEGTLERLRALGYIR